MKDRENRNGKARAPQYVFVTNGSIEVETPKAENFKNLFATIEKSSPQNQSDKAEERSRN